MSPRRFDEPDGAFDPPRVERCAGPVREEDSEFADALGHDQQRQREHSLGVDKDLEACGTYGAYRRHQNRGEEIDEACEEAKKQYKTAWNTAHNKARQQLKDRHLVEFAQLRAERSGANGWQDTMTALVCNHPKEFKTLFEERKRAALGRCAKIPECLECLDLANALGHDHQGHAILKAVTRAEITTIEQLAGTDRSHLLSVRNLGPARITRLRDRLAKAQSSPR